MTNKYDKWFPEFNNDYFKMTFKKYHPLEVAAIFLITFAIFPPATLTWGEISALFLLWSVMYLIFDFIFFYVAKAYYAIKKYKIVEKDHNDS